MQHDFPGLGPRRLVLKARRIATVQGKAESTLPAMVAIAPLEKS